VRITRHRQNDLVHTYAPSGSGTLWEKNRWKLGVRICVPELRLRGSLDGWAADHLTENPIKSCPGRVRRFSRSRPPDSTPMCAGIGRLLDHRIYDAGMRSGGFVVGVVLALMGAVWVLQGLNSQIVPQSFMTGSRTWIVIGLLALVSGTVLAWRGWLRR
jgi:hypothetical protein